jgi:8-oxo-dGTP pyrophosphatase MutT (NUDIX family)
MKDNFEQNNLKGTESPKLCYTAGGVLIHDNKVLLIKHKKLGIWLNPGGHIDEGELPHQAAEREFFEETGVRVRAVDTVELLGKQIKSFKSKYNKSVQIQDEYRLAKLDSEFKPNPFSTNLHWVSEENYTARLNSADTNKRSANKVWKRGCEQHVSFLFMLQPTNGVEFYQNIEETDGIAWFSLEEISSLETIKNVRDEIKLAFTLT